MELLMKIDARPCNIALEGNNIFPRRFFVNVKEASGIFLIPCDEVTNLHRQCTRILILNPEFREDIIFGTKLAQKRFFMEIPFITEKNSFHVPLHPFQAAKVDSGQKLTQMNKKNRVKSTFAFSLCQEQPLDSWLSFSNSFRTTLV